MCALIKEQVFRIDLKYRMENNLDLIMKRIFLLFCLFLLRCRLVNGVSCHFKWNQPPDELQRQVSSSRSSFRACFFFCWTAKISIFLMPVHEAFLIIKADSFTAGIHCQSPVWKILPCRENAFHFSETVLFHFDDKSGSKSAGDCHRKP